MQCWWRKHSAVPPCPPPPPPPGLLPNASAHELGEARIRIRIRLRHRMGDRRVQSFDITELTKPVRVGDEDGSGVRAAPRTLPPPPHHQSPRAEHGIGNMQKCCRRTARAG